MKTLKIASFIGLLILIFSFSFRPFRAVSTNTTIDSRDADGTIVNTGGNVTFTLANDFSNGDVVTLLNHGTGIVTISPAIRTQNGKTINSLSFDATTIDANTIGNSLRIVWDNTNSIWRKI